MMMAKRLLLMLALPLLAFWVCQTTQGIAEENKEARIDQKVRVNAEFTITKDDNPTTGYEWQVDYDKEYLEFLGREYRSHKKPWDKRLGVGGTSKFTFRALMPGLTRIIMKYHRPWEQRPFPEETINVLIY